MAQSDELSRLKELEAQIARLEAKLSESEGRARSPLEARGALNEILNVALDGILTIDEAGVIRYVNPALSQIFGFEEIELLGQNVKMLISSPHDHRHDEYIERYRKSRKKRILGRSREVMAKHRDGTFFPIEIAVSEIFDGKERLFTGTIRDISERREAEARIIEDRDRLREIFNSAVDGIIAIDESGIILEANSAIERIFHYEAKDLVGQKVEILMPPPFKEEHASYLTQYIETGTKRIIGIGREVRGRRKNGDTFPLFLAVSEGLLEHRRVFTAFLHDLDELREVEERARQAEQLAEVSTISAGIAHDVGTPMTTILGYAELLQKTSDDPKNRERAGHIVDQVRRVKDLLRTLLDIAQPREATPAPISLGQILDHSLEFFREKLKGRGVIVEREYSRVPKVMANRDRLEQVFLNLIVNATDAMPSGGTLTVHLAEISPDLVEVGIADTGIGIDAKSLGRIFEPFYTTKERGKGTGLGLLVSQRIIHDHGGKITAKSELGVGTQITIRLPVETGAPLEE